MKTITKTKQKRKLSGFFERFAKKVNKNLVGAADRQQTKERKVCKSARTKPNCSNCTLEMNLIENENLWFCPLGCSKKPIERQTRTNKNGLQAGFEKQITPNKRNLTQGEINHFNKVVDHYNAKLEKVLNDENLYADFETILEEQKAVYMIDGRLSEMEAESQVTQPKNVREIVISL